MSFTDHSSLGYTFTPPPSAPDSVSTSQLLSPASDAQTTSCAAGNSSELADIESPARSLISQPSPNLATSNPSVYNSSLLNYPRVSAVGLSDTMSSLYHSAYAAQGYVPFGGDPSAFYSPIGPAQNTDAWRNLSQGAAWPYDPTMAAYPYSTGYGGLDVRRKNATREATGTLKAWLYEHIKNPYPTKGEKIMLAIITKMTLTQVSTWFANARRRLKKENKMQWSPRNRTGDDDDDKDDSDVDETTTNSSNDAAGSTQKRDDADDDDEDIVVDGSSNTDHISSPSKSSDSMLRDTSVTSLDLSGASSSHVTSPLTSPLAAINQLHHANQQNFMTSPLSASLTAGLQRDPYAMHHPPHNPQLSPKQQQSADDNAIKDNSSQAHKPRIWSMADMATTSQTNNVASTSSPNAIAQSLLNKSGYTSFSSSAAPGACIAAQGSAAAASHPVFNGSYAPGLTTQVGTSLPAYRLGGYFTGAASMAGVLPPSFHHRPSSSMNVLPPATTLSRLNNNLMGNSLDATSFPPPPPSSSTLHCSSIDDSATAFKPVARTGKF